MVDKWDSEAGLVAAAAAAAEGQKVCALRVNAAEAVCLPHFMFVLRSGDLESAIHLDC